MRPQGRLPGAQGAQAQDREQQGRGEGQAREAEWLRQQQLLQEEGHARGHVFRRLFPARPQRTARGSLSGRRHYGFPRRLSAALSRSGRQRRACSRRLQECHRGPPSLTLKVLALPSPGPAPTHAHRPARRLPPARRPLENGARIPRGRKEGQRRGGRG